MSKPRYGWWSYAKYLTRIYPALKQEYDDLRDQRITADTARISNRTSVSRTTENATMRQLPPARQADYDAVAKAIERTKLLRTGPERLALIDMVFWKKSHSLDGAAYTLGYSDSTAKRFHRDFLQLVGLYRGLEDATI